MKAANKQYPVKIKTKKYVPRRGYLDILAAGLIEYARLDETFAIKLYALVRSFSASEDVEKACAATAAGLFVPADRESAVRRAYWLVGQLHDQGADAARTRLAVWARSQTYTSPRMVIIGIVGLAIPGITLGLIKRSVKMPVIIRHDIALRKDLKLSGSITAASHEVLKNTLVQMGGDIKQIDPDLADWFFGEKELVFYGASQTTINEIKIEMERNQIPYGEVIDNDEPAVLAVSPSVNYEHLSSTHDLSDA